MQSADIKITELQQKILDYLKEEKIRWIKEHIANYDYHGIESLSLAIYGDRRHYLTIFNALSSLYEKKLVGCLNRSIYTLSSSGLMFMGFGQYSNAGEYGYSWFPHEMAKELGKVPYTGEHVHKFLSENIEIHLK